MTVWTVKAVKVTGDRSIANMGIEMADGIYPGKCEVLHFVRSNVRGRYKIISMIRNSIIPYPAMFHL